MATSRNAPCPCGSGKKYKRCCGAIGKAPASNISSGNILGTQDNSDPKSFPDRTFELHTGVKISAPYSLKLITAYVLTEQQDWFEDEIDFVRYLVKPGMNAVDIGANYGIYTFSMAQQTANQGKIWAFEPTTDVMKHLKYSKQLNLANNVELVQCALSDHTGEATLSLNDSAELNQLEHNDTNPADDNSEVVALKTLDEYFESIDVQSIDFMKLDAEGEEVNIIKGGHKFFSTYSPLVMYEFVHAGKVNEGLIAAFEGIGYDNYRLIPGLNVLVPLQQDDLKLGFLLNLFACNKEQAKKLESKGLLIVDTKAECKLPNNLPDYLDEYYKASPVASALAPVWNSLPENDLAQAHNIIGHFMIAHDNNLSALQRFRAMETAYHQADEYAKNKKSMTSLSTYARIAHAFGHRSQAIEALQSAALIFNETRSVEVSEPVLPALSLYDKVNPGDNAAEWLLSSLLEGYEKLRHWSSYFSGDSGMQNLMAIKELGFASDEVHRRISLREECYMAQQKS